MPQIEDEAPSWLADTPASDPGEEPTPPPTTFAAPEPKAQPAAAPLADANTGATPSDDPTQMTDEEKETLKGVILFMRVANLGVSIATFTMAIIYLLRVFSSPTFWVLCMAAACGSLLICCLETQLSFIRTSIALNFGFLFNPVLRFLYYLLLATVCYSLGSLFSFVCAGCLIAIALYNTFVLIKYPAYRKLRDQAAAEEDERINAAIRNRVRNEASAAMFTSAR